MRRDAIFSPCGKYRLRLDREWDDPAAKDGRVCGLLLNPSDANAHRNDPTVGTFTSFCRVWGYRRFTFVNLFALVSTDPSGLITHPDPIGPGNDEYILRAIEGAALVVVAWGARVPSRLSRRVDNVLELIGPTVDLWCLGQNADRSPKHPLRLAHSTPLVRFYPRRAA